MDKRGIHVLTGTSVEDVALEGKGIRLYVTGDKCVNADHVIVATGIEPNTDLAKDSCLELDPVNGGFLVNAEMQSMTGLYAAGDCASFYDCVVGRRREEHHNYALATGQIAGENMAGRNNRLNVQPYFWCHLAPDYEIEGAGIVDTKYPTVGVFPKSEPESLKMEENEDDVDDDKDENEDQSVSQLAHSRNIRPSYLDAQKKDTKKKETAPKDLDKNNAKGGDADGKMEEISTKTTPKETKEAMDKKKDEGAGEGDPNYDRVEDDTDVDNTLANQNFEKGVIYYLNDKQEIIGVLTLNLPGMTAHMQELIKQKKTYDDINEVTQSFDLHKKDPKKNIRKLGLKKKKH
ncbi:hypothetical protein GE061_011055 [Apolygus lucorum]|uniref:FAD/NAD(P)-binding domain-containing protein n=1 Tax=Apolygus lucorum TaxID=248454 RepID=A0A8S9XZ14_APOLU|nr:hypothetical protein GE061_011055 [Apolygus lucorum]